MYKSPINQILGEMQITYENECLKAVQSVGFDVNKEELAKALMYDRDQYEEGYSDAINHVKRLISKRLREECNFNSCDDCERCCEIEALLHIESQLD